MQGVAVENAEYGKSDAAFWQGRESEGEMTHYYYYAGKRGEIHKGKGCRHAHKTFEGAEKCQRKHRADHWEIFFWDTAGHGYNYRTEAEERKARAR